MAAVEVLVADVTRLEVDAIANAANTDLKHGGGVAGAISWAADRRCNAKRGRQLRRGLGSATISG